MEINKLKRKIETLRQQMDGLQQCRPNDSTQLAKQESELVAELQNMLQELQLVVEELDQQDEAAADAATTIAVERQRVKAAMQAGEARYAQLLEAVTDYIYSVKVEGDHAVATTHGPGCVTVTGFTSQEYETDPQLWYRMVYPEDRDAVVAQASRILSGKEVTTLEHRLIHKDGSIRWVRNTPVPQYNEQGHLVAYDGLIADITDRKRFEVERERLLVAEREQRLLAETLGEVFLALTSQINHDGVLNEILYQAQRIVPYDGAHIVLLENETLRVARWRGYETYGSEQELASLEQSLPNFPLDAEVARSLRPLVIPDTTQNPHWVTVPGLAWIKSFVNIPICLHGQVLGMLRLDGAVPGKFSARDAKRLQPLANAAAIALENAWLYDQAQQELAERKRTEVQIIQRNAELLALQFAGAAIASSLDLPYVLNTVTKELANMLGVEGCTIFEWDQATQTISVTVEYGLASWGVERSLNRVYDVAEFPLTRWISFERRIHLADFPLAKQVLTVRRAQQMTIHQADVTPAELADLQTISIKTLLLLPMEFQQRVVGLVALMDDQTERTFSQEETALAQLLANQAASAIENARLYQQARHELVDRIQAEKDLRQVALKNQAMLDAIPDSMFYFSRTGQLLDYKVANNSDLPPGILSETIIGKKLNDLLPADLVELTLHYIGHTLDSGTMQTFEYQLFLPEGPQYFEARLVTNGPNEVLAIVRNITRRKQMEEALKKSEANLAASEARLLEEMESVLIITHALVSEINLTTLLEFIITQAEHLLNADGAAVLFLSEDGQYLEVAKLGESWLRIRPGSRVLVGGSLAEQALITRQTQTSHNVLGDSRTKSMLALLESAQVSSLLCAPLLVQRKNLGVLMVWGEREQLFNTQDSGLMNMFANQAALALHNAHLHALNRQMAIEQERHRLARELHDSVTQSLYSIGLAAQTGLKLLGKDLASEVQSPLEHIHTLSQIALTEMREQLYDLQPTALNEGLVTALSGHCHMLSKQYALDIELKTNLDSSLSIDRQHTLYYLVREALWNVVKHASATHVNINMTSQDDQIVISIADDGVGFDPLAVTKGETLGLSNMQERAALLGGTFELQSTPGQGTWLTVRIPSDDKNNGSNSPIRP